MTHITYRAARVFFNTSKTALFSEVIDWTEFLERLLFLRELCSEKNPTARTANRILTEEEYHHYDDTSDREHSSKHTQTERNGKCKDDDDKACVGGSAHGGRLSFFPCSRTGLSEWSFHQYDDDFFPSIPHGHWHGATQPKLDPYQGWIYYGSKRLRRESKEKIVALWNDNDFREFSLAAIEYYLDRHEKYNGWRIKNPRRLPRRR